MDLFLKLSVLEANLCWLGDLEKNISLEGICWWEMDDSGCLRGNQNARGHEFVIQSSSRLLLATPSLPTTLFSLDRKPRGRKQKSERCFHQGPVVRRPISA